MRTETRLPGFEAVPAAPTRDDRFLMVGLAAAAVWVAVGTSSLFAPDMVTGSLQEHLPIAAITMWLWGAIATGFILMTGAMGRGVIDGRWRALTLVVVAIWAVVAVASIWAPQLVTGTDPTRIPLAALLAPVAATIGTAFACLFAAGAPRSARPQGMP
jgi:hypothetical protein